MNHPFDVQGQVAVLTGGTGVLGRAMAESLVDAGARVAVASRTQEKADRVASELRANGGEVIGLNMDAADCSSVEAAAECVRSEWGRVDLLVNAAGGNNPKATAHGDLKFFDLPPAALRDVIDLNLMGTVVPSQVFGRVMAEQGRGSIINISSLAASRPLTRVVGYSAAKAALTAFDAAAARELRRGGIRLLDIRPPHTETGLATRPRMGTAPRLPEGLSPDAVAERIVTAITSGEKDLPSSAFTASEGF